MNKQLTKVTLGWGILLWFIGYVLGMLLFFVVPAALIGWIITPIGILITLWVLLKKIKSTTLSYYVSLACVWTIVAIVLDYIFIIKALHPADGYYKLDVYLYYALTFVLPLLVGLRKRSSASSNLE